MTDQPIRVLIVDDHDMVREGLAAIIGAQKDMEVIASTGSGAEALALCAREQPAVVLLDLRMEGMDGLATLSQLRARFPSTNVLMLSSHDGDEAIFRALKAGAAGYVLKKQPAAELIAAVRGAAGGKAPMAPEVSQRLAARLLNPTLSEREIQVLELVARGESNKEIAQQLHISASTVKNHIDSILHKLDASDRTEAVTIALQRGIMTLD